MNGWLLDSNVVAELLQPKPDHAVETWSRAQPRHRVYISVLTLAEIEQGLWALPTNDRRRPGIEVLLIRAERIFAGRTLSVDDAIVRRWARIRGTARRTQRKQPPPIDALFAATAIEHGLYLASRNVADFELTGVRVFDPWTDDPEAFPLR